MSAMPEDVKAYMVQAATQIAQEQGFVPESESDMTEWLTANQVIICKTASSIMWSLLKKLDQPQVKEAITNVLCAKVWAGVRNSENNLRANRAIREALA